MAGEYMTMDALCAPVTAVFKKVGTAKNKNRYHKFDHRLGLRPISVPQPYYRHIGLRIRSKNLPYEGTYKSYLVLW